MLHFFLLVAIVAYSDASPRRYSDTNYKVSQPRADAERIPDGITPVSYKIDLIVTEETLTAPEATFTGVAEITFAVNNGTIFNAFPIHAKEIDLDGAPTLSNPEDSAFTPTIDVLTDDVANNFWRIDSSLPLTTGTYLLRINYVGKLSDTDLDGFYRSWYKDADENQKFLASTQFEEFGARRAFPCFDEPALKATFTVSVTYSEGYQVVFNTPPAGNVTDVIIDGVTYKNIAFRETPLMSTYLVAFIVYDAASFQCLNGEAIPDNLENQLCSRTETEDFIQTALDVAPKALDALYSFTGVRYDSMGVGKMTQAAIPDFFIGAMENWGLVTYREADILWDPEQSSNSYLQTVATVITHEFSHQWFGDKVTLDWWTNIFLNEGFATYFQYYGTNEFQDQWELPKQFVLEQLQPVLISDSSASSLPLSYPTNDRDEIIGRFDDISYNKGGSIFRMVQHFLELDVFKTGLNIYLNKGPIGRVNELWSSFQDAVDPILLPLPDTIANIMDSWTYKAGYPLITVNISADGARSVTISQTRFLLSGEDVDQTEWYVPITYATSNNPDFTRTQTRVWLPPASTLTIYLDDDTNWIILNNQQIGYYRVKYDDQILANISTALIENVASIDEISRSQLVDDQFNFARGETLYYSNVLDFVRFLTNDSSYYTWYSAFNGFSYILRRTSSNDVRDALKNDIRTLMTSLVNASSIDVEQPEDQIYTLRQVLSLQWACDLNLNDCPSEARSRFVDYTTNGQVPSPNLKALVYCNGLRQSDNVANDFDFLYNIYLASDLAHERVTILKALGCVNDANLRQTYLQKALTDEVRIQDVRYVFQAVYTNTPDGVDDVLTFIENNYTQFNEHFGGLSQSTLISLISNTVNWITTQAQIDSLNEFLNIEDLDESVREEGTAAVEFAENVLVVIENIENVLKQYYNIVP